MEDKKYIFRDLSLWSLILSNLIVIFSAIKSDWSLPTILWIYWFQSIIIGFFVFIKIIQLKDFSVIGNFFDSFIFLGKIKNIYKIGSAFFFLLHYGGFHLIYLFFLLSFLDNLSGNMITFVNWNSIFFMVIIFFFNHLFSFIYNKPNDTKKENINRLMSYPYARILPMHLTIIIGFIFISKEITLVWGSFFVSEKIILLFFLALKMIADVKMHLNEHKINEEIFNINKIIQENKIDQKNEHRKHL